MTFTQTISSVWVSGVRTFLFILLTLWNRPFYGLFLTLLSPFVAYTTPTNEMIQDIEYYIGTLAWVETGRCKGVAQGRYERVAPRPEWLNQYA